MVSTMDRNPTQSNLDKKTHLLTPTWKAHIAMPTCPQIILTKNLSETLEAV